jgi:hypothetical protein
MSQYKNGAIRPVDPCLTRRSAGGCVGDTALQSPWLSLRHQSQDAAALCVGWKAFTQEKSPLRTVTRADSKPS